MPRGIIPTEHSEQVSLFTWAGWQVGQRPELNLLYAIPNGGKRSIGVAVKLKKEGVKAGMPDVCLPVARNGYHSLYIEMKRQKGGTVSAEQKKAIADLQEQGHRVEVCKGWQNAVAIINLYLDGHL